MGVFYAPWHVTWANPKALSLSDSWSPLENFGVWGGPVTLVVPGLLCSKLVPGHSPRDRHAKGVGGTKRLRCGRNNVGR